MLHTRREWTTRLAFLGLAAVTLVNGGCLAAAVVGAAGGGAAALYTYQRGQLYREYSASQTAAATAVRTSLAELKFPPAVEKGGAGEATFETKTADGSKVRIHLESVANRIPVDGAVTRVSVRVGTLGDDEVSARILDQVSVHLIVPVSPPAGPPAVAAPVTPRPFETAAPPLAAAPTTAGK